MRFFPNVSIQRKQMIIIMLTSSIALLLACAAFVYYEIHGYRTELRRHLADVALRIAEQNTGALEFDDLDLARANLDAVLIPDQNILEACIYARDGSVFAKYRRGDPAANFTPPPIAAKDGSHFSGDEIIMFRTIQMRNDDVHVYLKSDLKEMYARLKKYAVIVTGVLIVSLLVALMVSSLLQRVISQPILHLVETAKNVSQKKNYAVRAKKHGDDELGVLIDGFNTMLEQIQARDVELQKAHSEMEQRVVERTGELQSEVQERTRAEQSLQQQLLRISLLNQITHAVSERQDLNSVVQVVLRQLEDHLPVSLGVVLLHESKNKTMNVAALRLKNPTHATELKLEPQSNLTLEHLDLSDCFNGKTVYVQDTSIFSSPVLSSFSKSGLRSAVAVPLLVENSVFGVLMVARENLDSFSSGECEFLRMLSEHVGLAAHQARLHAELRDAYNELRQTQQAVMQQERLRALGKMASGIAHDINNALSPIIVYAEMVSRNETLSPTSKKHLDHIKTAGEDIAHIVSRMREFYRKREENEPLFPIALNALLDQVVELTRPRWRDISQQRGVVIDMETSFYDGLPEIQGNASELREALTNLIFNAVDAMPTGGKLTVRTHAARREIESSDQKNGFVILEVIDSGTGMDEEARARCFEPFFSTKGQRGTGLGLAMVYGIMERHDGRIEVDSKLGEGTTMRLIFPVREHTSTVQILNGPETKTRIPLHILCIDDEPLLRELLKELLEADGHTVSIADGGQAGIDAFRESQKTSKPFQIVITDLGMPYVDGRKVATTIKLEFPSTPIVMLTGWGTMMKADGDLPAQVDAVISKPPRINELRETLAKISSQFFPRG